MRRDWDEIFSWRAFLTHSAYTLTALGVIITLLTIFPSFLSVGKDNSNIEMEINTGFKMIDIRLDSLEREQQKLSTQVLLLQNHITDFHSKMAAGDLNETDLLNISVDNCSISINSSLNNSKCDGRFDVFGTTTIDSRLIEEGIYKIYVILYLNSMYMIQSEGYTDTSQNWVGYRPCLIPDNRYNATIYAIITKEDLLIASILEKMPEYISISEPVYRNTSFIIDSSI